MKIALLIEGDTEKVFLPYLRRFLETRLAGQMPRIDCEPYDGRIPKGDDLRDEVHRLLYHGKAPADAVIALTDVYTGTGDFQSADAAKKKMREWVGVNDRFFPHAAQYEFEAWLLPFWGTIQRLAGHNKAAPGGTPEAVNHNRPPSVRIFVEYDPPHVWRRESVSGDCSEYRFAAIPAVLVARLVEVDD